MFQDFDEVADPGMLGLRRGLPFLIGPVGGEAVLGLGVHFLRADLDFDPHLLVVDHRGVERAVAVALRRSEEHTSELQSLMRISYAVFCLKKKNEIKTLS